MTGLRDFAIPDFAWGQSGANRMSGAHSDKKFASFASRFTQDHQRRFTAFGAPDPEAPGAVSLDAQFDAAAAASKTLRRAPDNDTLLALYSLFKQASVGDVSGDRPGALDMVNCAKYDAWSQRKGMGRDDAMNAYVELAARLKEDDGT